MIEHNDSLADQSGWSPKTLNGYITGFIACLLLTAASFLLVEYMPVSKPLLYLLISVFALLQMLIQSVCFLGLNTGRTGQWNFLPFLFTILIVIFLIGGSMWIMYNLNVLMMSY